MAKPKSSTSTVFKTNTLLLAATTASLLTTHTTATPLLNPRHNTAQTALTSPFTTTTTTTTTGASCTVHVPFDNFTKDDWDFCCLQEYGAPSMTSARTGSVFTDWATASDGNRVAEQDVDLRCELRAEYAESLEGCFREFAGVWEGVGCVGIEEFEDGEKSLGEETVIR